MVCYVLSYILFHMFHASVEMSNKLFSKIYRCYSNFGSSLGMIEWTVQCFSITRFIGIEVISFIFRRGKNYLFYLACDEKRRRSFYVWTKCGYKSNNIINIRLIWTWVKYSHFTQIHRYATTSQNVTSKRNN